MADAGLKYYVINLPKSTDRRERFTKRLVHHKIIDQSVFIEAVDKSSPLIDWFEQGCSFERQSTRPEHACFLSHLKAIRTFLLDPEATQAVIFEDDAMLHNDFKEKLNYVLTHKAGLPLIMLCFFFCGPTGVQILPLGDDPNRRFLTVGPLIYGTQSYWISKQYAAECIQKLDKPLLHLPFNRITSEIITQLSRGAYISPPIVIEESINSNIQPDGQMSNHRNYYSQFGIENYNASDDINIRDLWDDDGSKQKHVVLAKPPPPPKPIAEKGMGYVQVPKAVDKEVVAWLTNGWWGNHEACIPFIKHLSALKQAVNYETEWIVITEPDVVYHKEFKSKVGLIGTRVPPIFQICLLSTMRTKPVDNDQTFYVPTEDTLFSFCYMIRRSHAEYLLHLFDQPFRNLIFNSLPPERLTRLGPVCALTKPIAGRVDNPSMLNYFSTFGIKS